MRLKLKGIRAGVLIALAVAIIGSGCGEKKPASGNWEETAFLAAGNSDSTSTKPLTIKLVVNDTYCKLTACQCIHHLASREYDKVLLKLKEAHNIDLQLVYCMEEDNLVDSIRSGRFDGAICKPWFAFDLMPGSKMKFKRIADINDPFDNTGLTGLIIVKKESPIQTIKEINGKILAVGQENSYEKYHLPLSFLEKEWIKPSMLLKKGSCTEGINLLLDGKADAAVISDYALTASCAVDFAGKDEFRTIYVTDTIPLCSVILDINRVSVADAARIQSALLEVSDDKTPDDFSSKGFAKPVLWQPRPFKGKL
jgi:ABC-type phosphate/phosphonate transport system substrate-binding protein